MSPDRVTPSNREDRRLRRTPRGSEPPVIGPPPPVDPEVAAAFVGTPDMELRPFTPDKIGAFRQMLQAEAVGDEVLRRGGTYDFFELTVPGPTGAPDITLLICKPVSGATPAPAIFHAHGGGMILGDRRDGMEFMLDVAAPHGVVVVSVEYRLAPENPAPAPVEDCYAGLVWVAAHADELGIDPARIVVAGASAGGGLAAGMSLMARDRNGPQLLGQMLSCPMLDDRNDTASAIQMRGVDAWDQVASATAWSALLGDRQGGPEVSPYDAPARAADLGGLPPALIDVGSVETFRDEAVDYALRIWQAGGSAELHVWPGCIHGYGWHARNARVSRAAVSARQSWLARLLAD